MSAEGRSGKHFKACAELPTRPLAARSAAGPAGSASSAVGPRVARAL